MRDGEPPPKTDTAPCPPRRAALHPARRRAAPEARAPGGRRCRCRRGRLRARTGAAASPGSAPPKADPRCTSAARGAAGGRRSCGPRRSSPGCTWRRPRRRRILICLATRFTFTWSTIRSMILQQVVVGQRGEQDDLVQAVEELGVEGALHLGHAPCPPPWRDAVAGRRREAHAARVFSRKRAPRFEVMMMMVFLKSTVLPSPSVNWPSSNTCSRML